MIIKNETHPFHRSASPPAFVANAVALMLGHGHSVSSEDAASLPSFRALRHAWAAEGYSYNDALKPGEEWSGGMIGWYPEVYDDSPLAYETASRLRFSVDANEFALILSSADEPDFLLVQAAFENAGEKVAIRLTLKAAGNKNPKAWLNEEAAAGAARLAELLDGRADRVFYLWLLDQHLDGAITEGLEKMLKHDHHAAPIARVLLDAKEREK